MVAPQAQGQDEAEMDGDVGVNPSGSSSEEALVASASDREGGDAEAGECDEPAKNRGR